MPQINVDFEEDVVRNLDRIAAKQSIRRSDLLRRTARELIEAEATGREPFTLVVEEMTAKDISEVIAKQRALGDDLDQMLKANRKREAALHKSEMALQRLIALHEADTIAARERGQREAEQALEEGLVPFRAEIAALRKDLEAAQASDPRMDAIEAELAELKKLAAQPRTQRNLVLGDDRMLSFRFLSGMGLIALVLGGILSLILVAEIPSWGVVASNRSLDGDAGICRLLEYRYGVQDCQVPAANRIDRTPPAPVAKSRPGRKSERR